MTSELEELERLRAENYTLRNRVEYMRQQRVPLSFVGDEVFINGRHEAIDFGDARLKRAERAEARFDKLAKVCRQLLGRLGGEIR